MDSLSPVRDGNVFVLSLNLCWSPTVIMCICNGLNDEDIKKICDSCQTKEEFEDCVQKKMCERSCHTCYTELVHSFEKNANEE